MVSTAADQQQPAGTTAEVAVQRAGARLANLLRGVMDPTGQSMPTFGACEDAIRAFDEAIGLTTARASEAAADGEPIS
jgi:hypothetical protein